MSKLYTEYANIYYEMYMSLFNYKSDFNIYNNILRKFECRSVLELGCGNGNLAPYFLEKSYNYVGVDLHEEMLNIARKKCPDVKFVKDDMRYLQIEDQFDSVIIPGRSFSYMLTNDDVMNTLKSIYNVLKKGGVLIFDNFNAEHIFTEFGNKEIKQTAKYKTRKYIRISTKTPNLETGWTWNWNATYYIYEEGKKTKILKDDSVLRAFIKDELTLFLTLNNFKVLEVTGDDFAFTTVAQK